MTRTSEQRSHGLPRQDDKSALSNFIVLAPAVIKESQAIQFRLDGLLYNESELEIEEHYTDTPPAPELSCA
jgi:hypothetical protein